MADLAQRLARGLLERLDALTDELVSDIRGENGGYQEQGRVSSADLWGSCRDNMERVMQILEGSVPGGGDGHDAARFTGTRRAEQRVPLDALLRSYRFGGRVIWRGMAELARHDEELDREQLLDLATRLWTVVDEMSLEVSKAYRRTEERLHQLDAERRHALIEGLLGGRAREAAFAEQVATELGFEADGDYLVLVIELAADGTSGIATPEDALAVHGLRSVWQRRGQTTVGLIALGQRDAAGVLNILKPGVRARAGVGPAARGLAEIGVAHDFALVALRTLPAGEVGIAELDEHLPEALLTRSPELADRLIDAVLGPVLRLPTAERDVLLETLTVWLDVNGSMAAAASRLYCHRNTVLNRMRRLERLLGRTVAGRRNYMTLSFALLALGLRDVGDRSAQRGSGESRHLA
ncbi:MAG: PucR family transcriptional regulator [Pseudonocardiaceae bacterium]|nr:PucR family transcriptional regulator [Pseudonocardiaceae bacterium]